jgi:hypothetical protein
MLKSGQKWPKMGTKTTLQWPVSFGDYLESAVLTTPRHIASERLPKAATDRKRGATRIGVFRTTHPFRNVFEIIDRRFALYRPTQKRLVWRRHADAENLTAIRNLQMRAPAAATLHSVLSTYVKIRPKMAETGDKTTLKSRVSGIIAVLDYPSPRRL